MKQMEGEGEEIMIKCPLCSAWSNVRVQIEQFATLKPHFCAALISFTALYRTKVACTVLSTAPPNVTTGSNVLPLPLAAVHYCNANHAHTLQKYIQVTMICINDFDLIHKTTL